MSDLDRQRDAFDRRAEEDDWHALNRRFNRSLTIAIVGLPLALVLMLSAVNSAVTILVVAVWVGIGVSAGLGVSNARCPSCSRPLHKLFTFWFRDPFRLACDHCGAGPPSQLIPPRPVEELNRDVKILDAAQVPHELVVGRLLVELRHASKAVAAFRAQGRQVLRLKAVVRDGYRLIDRPGDSVSSKDLVDDGHLAEALERLTPSTTHVELFSSKRQPSRDNEAT